MLLHCWSCSMSCLSFFATNIGEQIGAEHTYHSCRSSSQQYFQMKLKNIRWFATVLGNNEWRMLTMWLCIFSMKKTRRMYFFPMFYVLQFVSSGWHYFLLMDCCVHRLPVAPSALSSHTPSLLVLVLCVWLAVWLCRFGFRFSLCSLKKVKRHSGSLHAAARAGPCNLS